MSAARGPDQSVFDDLSSRFILNCPPEELGSFERIMFLIEQAHWFYEDTLRHEKKLRSIPVLKEFALLLFNHTSILRPYVNQFDYLYKRFNAYKLTVPVYGAIVLNIERSKVLMVKAYRSRCWGFPKGKVNKDESASDAAAREVLEEVGLDISGKIRDGDDDYKFTFRMGEKVTTLFIVDNVPEDTTITKTLSSYEIAEISWIPIDMLPVDSPDGELESKAGPGKLKTFMVIPFVKPLMRWIASRRPLRRFQFDKAAIYSSVDAVLAGNKAVTAAEKEIETPVKRKKSQARLQPKQKNKGPKGQGAAKTK